MACCHAPRVVCSAARRALEIVVELKRSVLVPYSAADMFDLIERAENYPKFLPWCTSATIFERTDEWVEARIEFSYLKFRFGFKTRNPKQRPDWLQVRLVEGPFKHFQGEWKLTPLGANGCRIEFSLAYEISDRIFDRMAGPAVQIVTRSMVDAFVHRAEATLPLVTAAQEPAPSPLPAAPPALEPAPQPAPQPAPEPAAVAAPTTLPATPMPASAPTPTPTDLQEATTMTTADTDLLEAVRSCRLAENLSPAQAQVLASICTLRRCAAHEVLAREGTADNQLVVIVEGALAVVKNAGQPDEAPLVTLNTGDLAHELGFLDGAPRYASLVAATDARVLVLDRAGLEGLIDSHPHVVYQVMCAIVRTVHRIQTRLSVQASELTNYIVKQHGRY